MFGYVKPYKPDLRVRELEAYRGIYCGLCRSMGIHTGCASRFSLSYDFVFLAAVRMVLLDITPSFSARRCPAHPLRKRPMCDDNPALSYCAAAAAVLTERKIKDDIDDTTGLRRLGARLLHITAARIRRRAAGKAPEEAIDASLEALRNLEKENCSSLDTPADTFGDLLSAVTAYGLSGGDARIAWEIGRSVGRYIYVLDAADDLQSDTKNGSYNPLRLAPIKPEALSVAVRQELAHLEAAVNLLDFTGKPELEGVISNIIYAGMPREADAVFAGKKTGKGKEKI